MVRHPDEAPALTLDLPEDTAAEHVPYVESGSRWMEKQEAKSLRRALEDMDVQSETTLHEAAQKEASELVWKHQNPDAPQPNPHAPYIYTQHLRQGSHTRSPSWVRAQDLQKSMSKKRDCSKDRSVSGGTKTNSSNSSRVPSDSSLKVPVSPTFPSDEGDESRDRNDRQSVVQFSRSSQDMTSKVHDPAISSSANTTRKASAQKDQPRSQSPQRSLSTEKTSSRSRSPKRKISGPKTSANAEGVKSSVAVVAPKMPASSLPHHFKNPFARLRSTRSSSAVLTTSQFLPDKRLERVEIHRNPPSQSRNPTYTTNGPVEAVVEDSVDAEEEEIKLKDGKEIRSDEIRKATSSSLKDRSEKLPTPCMVSDNPGRPIVSFDRNWKPKAIELKAEISASRPSKPESYPVPKAKQNKAPFKIYEDEPATKPVQPIRSEDQQAARKSGGYIPYRPGVLKSSTFPLAAPNSAAPIPAISVSAAPPIPTISVNAAPPIPTISVQGSSPIPTIAINAGPPVPTIAINNTPPVPSISVNAPSISISRPTKAPGARPLPEPTKGRPAPRHAATAPAANPAYRPHITPTSIRSSSVLCANCALPIAGRIVTAAGSRFHPECFRCCMCSEGLECVAFFPEPDQARGERIGRIQARQRGELLPEHDEGGRTEAEDGWDESMRFFCHLDFHELFSPRCKSCKTPIEGEVVIACGAEWHVGHFFCAQCGDVSHSTPRVLFSGRVCADFLLQPFNSTTPFVEKEGYAWCVNCHTNRYSAKCKKCRKPVTDTVVKALEAEWHEHCFVCTECKAPFADGRYFLRPGHEAEPFCPGCEARRLKA